MSPSQGSQRHLRPYQVTVRQDQDEPFSGAAAAASSADDLAKTDDLIRKLADANGGRSSSSVAGNARGYADTGRGGGGGGSPPRKFSHYPQSYHDQPYGGEEAISAFPSPAGGGGRGGSDLYSPYRGGDGRDAPPGYEFALRSYQHEGGGRGCANDDAAEAARRAEEDARKMAEATREMKGQTHGGGGYAVGPGRVGPSSSSISEGMQSCVRSMLSCLSTSAEGTLVGYTAAPGVGESSTQGAGGAPNPYVSSSIYGGFSDNRNNGAPPENTGLLGSMMR